MTPADLSTVAVLGCGTIGASWAKAFLEKGLTVRVWDPQPGVAAGLTAANGDTAPFVVCDTPAEAVAGAAFVQESGPEDLDLKRRLYGSIAGAVAEECVVASSTSTLPATILQQGCRFADRVLVGHPFNPPHILPLVEVVGGEATSQAAIDQAMTFYRAIGKRPIRLKVERPGHLANRLQAAIWREAVDAVASGQASVEDVDAAVTLALGPRWALMGPFATFNLGGGEGGLEHFLDHLGGAFEALWDDAKRPVVTETLKVQMAAAARLGQEGLTIAALARRRDRKLVEVLNVAASV